MSAAITLPAGVELCHLPAQFPLAHGGVLAGASLAFERQGPVDAPVVVVLGGISAGRHVSAHRAVQGPGWWEGFVGEGQAIDTARYSVLSFDWLGGAGCSTAPASGESFPFVGTEDQAAALAHLLTALRIEKVAALVGSSYGGMVGLQFAAAFPQRVARLCAIAAPHESHPQASAWRAVQRGIAPHQQAVHRGTAGGGGQAAHPGHEQRIGAHRALAGVLQQAGRRHIEPHGQAVRAAPQGLQPVFEHDRRWLRI